MVDGPTIAASTADEMGDLMAQPHTRTSGDGSGTAETGVTGEADATPGRSTTSTCSGASSWQVFVRTHALLTRQIETDLLSAHQLSLVSFEVLERLSHAPGRRLRMAELADLLVVSRSGVTRAVDRLARQGLVEREACDSDLRGTYATLTVRGAERLAAAAPTHAAGVQFYLLGPLGPAGDDLGELFEPVLARLLTT